MKKITGKQSKAARALLKWNLPDLASRTRVQPKRVESFEKGGVQLQGWEITEMVKAYQKEGITFKTDLSVKLNKKGDADGNSSAPALSMSAGEGEKIVITDVSQFSSLTAEQKAAIEAKNKKGDK